MNSNTPAYRVWNLTAYAMQDGAVLSVHTYTVKVERVGDTLTGAYVDGRPVSIERVALLLTWARDTGTVRQVEVFDPAPALPLGEPHAYCLHRILSRLGHADHYRAASAALGRMVASLTALTEVEARTVWNHARARRLAYQLAAARPDTGSLLSLINTKVLSDLPTRLLLQTVFDDTLRLQGASWSVFSGCLPGTPADVSAAAVLLLRFLL